MSEAGWDDETPKRIKSVPGLIFFFVLLLGSFGGTLGEASLAYASGHILGAAALLCTVLYFAWLRGAAIWKMIVCFAAVLLIVTLGTLAKLGAIHVDAQRDATTIADMRFDAEGNPIFRDDAAARGPMSKIVTKIASDTVALNKEYAERMERAGMIALFDATRVRNNPAMLKNCGAIDAIGPDVPTYRRRHLAIMDDGMRDLAASDMAADVKESAMAGARESINRAKAGIERIWSINAAQVVEAGAVCRILARGNWEARGPAFAFHSPRDMHEFNRHNDRLNALSLEQQGIVDASRGRMKQQQEAVRERLN